MLSLSIDASGTPSVAGNSNISVTTHDATGGGTGSSFWRGRDVTSYFAPPSYYLAMDKLLSQDDHSNATHTKGPEFAVQLPLLARPCNHQPVEQTSLNDVFTQEPGPDNPGSDNPGPDNSGPDNSGPDNPGPDNIEEDASDSSRHQNECCTPDCQESCAMAASGCCEIFLGDCCALVIHEIVGSLNLG